MISRRSLLPALGAPFLACRRPKGAGFLGYAIIANREAQTLAAVDLTSFSLARRIPLGSKPALVLASRTGPLAWVLSPEAGILHEIDAAGLQVRRRTEVARVAASMKAAPDGRSLWVLSREPRQLVRVDLERFHAGARIGLPAVPSEFDLSPDGRWAAVSLTGGSGISFVDLEARRANAPADPGREYGQVRFRSDGRHLLAGSARTPDLSIMEAPSGRIVVRLALAVRPRHFCFKSDGGQLFLAGEGMDAVVLVYPYRTEVAETALAGKAPGNMAASTSPEYLFVSNPPAGDVTILDIETRRAIAVVAVGGRPGAITITPDNQYALVLNEGTGSMAVIRIAAIVSRRTKAAPLFNVVPVGSGPVSAAVCRV